MCWDNWISREQWEEVIRQIESSMGFVRFDDTVFDFYTRFVAWIGDTLGAEEMIVVEEINSGIHEICRRRNFGALVLGCPQAIPRTSTKLSTYFVINWENGRSGWG